MNILSIGAVLEHKNTELAAPKGPRALHVIAREIANSWPNVNYAAKPYLAAMRELSGVTDFFWIHSVVLYFLFNATTWKGEDARRIKAELRTILKAR